MSQFPATPSSNGSQNRPSGYDADRLYDLLPAAIRRRDIETGQPLRALLQVIAEQVNLVDRDIAGMYDNWFIETCRPWVVPYLGDLIDYKAVPSAEPGDSELLETFLYPRREVANLIRYRRRKGTLGLLEQIARDSAGWPAMAVEFGPDVATTANLNNPHPRRGRTLDLRKRRLVAAVGTPFDDVSHTVDVRRVGSRRGPGKFNIAAVGLFVWRIKALPLRKAAAYCCESKGHRFTFSILGNDAPLYTAPAEPTDPPLPATSLEVPIPIARRAFGQLPSEPGPHRAQVNDDYYGEGKSVAIYRQTKPTPGNEPEWKLVPASEVIPADLTRWAYTAPPGRVAVDPVRGRILFHADEDPHGVLVSYRYGFSAPLGGGGYVRSVSTGEVKYRVNRDGKPGTYASIDDAVGAWRADADKTDPDGPATHAVIEITDSRDYGSFRVDLNRPNEQLEIRAAPGERPTVYLADARRNEVDSLTITAALGTRLVLDGLLIAGHGLNVTGSLRELVVRHCTLVPGWDITHDCCAVGPNPSIEASDSVACIRIDHSIIGTIYITESLNPQEWTDPVRICISDSILDSTLRDGIALVASSQVGNVPVRRAHAAVRVVRSTVIGRVLAREAELLENSIFTGLVDLARRQVGCVRFCYLPTEQQGSRTPRRYECQPDGVIAGLDPADADLESARVRPQFVSVRYGAPGYCRLSDACAPEIRTGADDESEMGVFHDLFEPQRMAGLRTRIAEFTPVAADADVIPADTFDPTTRRTCKGSH